MNFSEKHTCLLVQGSQAAEFLQGQITIDTEKISNEDFKPACVCNNKGRVITTFWIKKVENGFKIAILEEYFNKNGMPTVTMRDTEYSTPVIGPVLENHLNKIEKLPEKTARHQP